MRKETSTTRRNRKGNGNVVENICRIEKSVLNTIILEVSRKVNEK